MKINIHVRSEVALQCSPSNLINFAINLVRVVLCCLKFYHLIWILQSDRPRRNSNVENGLDLGVLRRSPDQMRAAIHQTTTRTPGPMATERHVM